MGPTTLFDKSFLQSLSIDESVWFDHFFLTNVCPVFFVETLADLEKSVRVGRTPEREVGIIADKFPQMHSAPCAEYRIQCIAELLGCPVPMTGQIPISRGRLVSVEGGAGMVVEKTPEAEAFHRWQRHEFLEVERQFAQHWRHELSTLDLALVSKAISLLGINPSFSKSLDDSEDIALSLTSGRKKPYEVMVLALAILGIQDPLRKKILRRWIEEKRPSLVEYAPYTAHVMAVEVFFQIAVAANQISSKQPSNRLDVAYLFYLPFCMMFVSSDKLHQRLTPLFLRNDQEFVWGQELKEDLKEINTHFIDLPNETKEKGIMSFASYPPKTGKGIVRQLWKRFLPKKVDSDGGDSEEVGQSFTDFLNKIEQVKKAPTFFLNEGAPGPSHLDIIEIKRSVARRKGSWFQVPKKT